MQLRRLSTAFTLFAFLSTAGVARQALAEPISPVGQWKSIDDETKEPKSIIEISEQNGKMVGKILKLFKKPTEDQNPKCTECKDDKKDQPIIGMQIIWDMEKRGSDYGNGHILDPKNGKTYNAKIKVIDDGKKLEVRGFMGISLLGRTQTWEKAN